MYSFYYTLSIERVLVARILTRYLEVKALYYIYKVYKKGHEPFTNSLPNISLS